MKNMLSPATMYFAIGFARNGFAVFGKAAKRQSKGNSGFGSLLATAAPPSEAALGTITAEIATVASSALNIDRYGLDEIDNKLLLTIIDKFRGRRMVPQLAYEHLGRNPYGGNIMQPDLFG